MNESATMNYLIVFCAGVVSGFGGFVAYGIYQVKKLSKAKAKLIEELKRKGDGLEQKKNSIKKRLLEASDIAKTQLDLKSQIELPSKNAIHSTFKNGLIFEINELELKKVLLLKSILEDGFDPMITIIKGDSGKQEEVPLSVYIAHMMQALNDSGMPPPQPPQPPADPADVPRKVGKFVVLKGGKDDGTSN